VLMMMMFTMIIPSVAMTVAMLVSLVAAAHFFLTLRDKEWKEE